MSSQMDAKKLATVAATTVVAGAAAYGIYYVVTKRSKLAKEKVAAVSITASIEKKHIAFLEEKAQEYCNNDSDAALKVLLDYAMTDGDEALIFETVRCNTCGGKKDKGDHVASVDAAHATFLEEMGTKHNLKDGTSKALRVIIEFAMTDGDVADIFTKARCDKWGAEPTS